MKQTVAVAVALVIVLVSVNAQNFHRRGLIGRSVSGGDLTTNVHGGPSGAGGSSSSGPGGSTGRTAEHKVGKHDNVGENAGQFGNSRTEMNGASTGQSAGNAQGGQFNGGLVYNGGAPFQFGGSMFDGVSRGGVSIKSDNNISRIASGGDASVTGTNNNRNGGFGDGNKNGGKLGGDTTVSGSTKATAGNSSNSQSGCGGHSVVGGGNSSKGGDGKLDISAKVGPAKRSLERRVLELEEDYAWILQQKRDLAMQEELAARFADVGDEEEYFHARSEDPEAKVFYARGSEFEEEDNFTGLNARDLWNSYLDLVSES